MNIFTKFIIINGQTRLFHTQLLVLSGMYKSMIIIFKIKEGRGGMSAEGDILVNWANQRNE